MADHEFIVTLENGHAIPRPVPPVKQMHVGETVRFVSNDGDLTVIFERSPFVGPADIIRGGEEHTLRQDGHFFCKCFIKTSTGTFGWRRGEKPQSGGEHDVKP